MEIYGLSSSKSNLKVGEEFTISVNLSNASVASLTARVTVDTSKIQYVSGPANSNFVNGKAIYVWTDATGGSSPLTGGTIVSFKFKAIAAGTASFSVSGDFFGVDKTNLNPSFSGTSVNIQEEQTVIPPENNNPSTNPETPSTTPDTGAGEVTTPTNPSTPPTNNNTSSLDSNTNLKTLKLSIEGLQPAFKKTTTHYTITVPNSITDIVVNATPESSKSKVSVTGNTGLVTGMNRIIIKVTAENGNTKEYRIDVTKTDNPELANTNLENLAIEFTTLEPAFQADILEYTATVGSDIEILNVLAVPQRENAQVTITGHENLQFGENTVEVRVLAEDGISEKIYTIKVYRKTQEEEAQELEEQRNEDEENQELIEQKEKKKNYTWVIIFILLVAAMIGILIYYYYEQNRKKTNKI